MKPHRLRRNWLWVAGGAFLGVHLITWLLQRTMKSAVHSEMRLRAPRTDPMENPGEPALQRPGEPALQRPGEP
ncbi:hypothetical protein NHX12_017849 [Muraenolepis orangiensis]|uniref:Uncharacterized protein n=1 Tax=Muraenolepis orangiensis TaxID=630683 RepID=A0A9Q0IXI4_9TELE|nr:hypothetical protein NHX12_017849 [Muraenolepis orangiensis]